MQIVNHKNNFGFLRLLLATLVIVSHSPEILDQSRKRELLTKIFGTISFGELAVDGFFLISGFLILKSYLSSSTIKSYFLKRVLRIYPGFIVASLICIFVLLPLSGEAHLIINNSLKEWLKTIIRLLTLDIPQVNGTKYASLNGAMWSVWLEFVCYMCIPILYFFNFNKQKAYILLATVLAVIFFYIQISGKNFWVPYIRLNLHFASKLMFAFLTGGLFYLFRDKIVWSKQLTIICAALLIVCLSFKNTAEIGLIVFGSYILFNFALNYKNNFLSTIGAKVDISYGVYLYAWPVEILIIKYYPQINLYFMMSLIILVTFLLGYISWYFVEKPFIELKKQLDLTINKERSNLA